WHWKAVLAWLEVKLNFGLRLRVLDGPFVIEVSGAAGGGGGLGVWMANDRVATAELPAASVACTRNVYEPSPSGLDGVSLVLGPEQPPKLAVPVSIEQRKVMGPTASVASKVKVGVLLAVLPVGPEVTLTCGAIESST